jgi:hypothetical protein
MNPSPGPELRRTVRMPGDTIGPLQVRADAAHTSISVHVRDVSIEGIGLLADSLLTPGTSLVIESGPGGKSFSDPLTAEIRHVTRLPQGDWLLGCCFSRLLTIDDMDALG